MTDSNERPLLFPDPVIEVYLKDVDRGLLRENLKLTAEERVQKFERFMRGLAELRAARITPASPKP